MIAFYGCDAEHQRRPKKLVKLKVLLLYHNETKPAFGQQFIFVLSIAELE